MESKNASTLPIEANRSVRNNAITRNVCAEDFTVGNSTNQF